MFFCNDEERQSESAPRKPSNVSYNLRRGVLTGILMKDWTGIAHFWKFTQLQFTKNIFYATIKTNDENAGEGIDASKERFYFERNCW